jgi:hypothetical protein
VVAGLFGSPASTLGIPLSLNRLRSCCRFRTGSPLPLPARTFKRILNERRTEVNGEMVYLFQVSRNLGKPGVTRGPYLEIPFSSANQAPKKDGSVRWARSGAAPFSACFSHQDILNSASSIPQLHQFQYSLHDLARLLPCYRHRRVNDFISKTHPGVNTRSDCRFNDLLLYSHVNQGT